MEIKLILICGSSGSGKSTISKMIHTELSKTKKVEILCQDCYYVDVPEDEKMYNFDHPSSFEWKLLIKDIKDILSNKPTIVPDYNYALHKKEFNNRIIDKPDVLIVEGIYGLYNEELNNLAALKIFVDTPKDECLIRRLKRDVVERGRDLENILTQWRTNVRPMYDQFIEPLKERANIIIPWSYSNHTAVDFLFKALSFK